MFRKKYLFIIIVFIIAISAVSAADTNTSDDAISIDESSELSVSSLDTSENLVDEDILKSTDDGSFSSLFYKINRAEEGSTVYLENDYVYDGRLDGVSIFKSITIDGQNHVIDASGCSNVFSMGNFKGTVVLKNIVFSNGNAGNYDGGFIKARNDHLEVSNCRFSSSSADTGGSIFMSGCQKSSTLKVTNCQFGASVASVGGCIYASNVKADITNCEFSNSHANTGGVIYVESNCAPYIANCNFIANFAVNKGGAIFTYADSIEIVGCNFTYNWVTDNSGGAIFQNQGNMIVRNSNFISNSAKSEGGAIYRFTGSNTLYDSIFKNNAAGKYSVINEGKAVRCTFEGNSLPVLNNVETLNCIMIKDKAILTLSKSGTSYGDVALTVSVKNQKKNTYLSNERVKIQFSNGQSTVLTTGSNGAATYKIPFEPGTYDATATLQSSDYDCDSVKLSNVVISKVEATVTPTALSTTYASGKSFQIKVTNAQTGNPLGDVKLKLKVYTGSKSKTVTVTTDADGIAKYSASKLAVGTHKVTVTPNDSKITASSKTSSVKISKAGLTITAPKAMGVYKKSIKYKVTVKNKASGKAVSGIKVTLKVYTGSKFQKITAKTNSKGQITYTSKTLSIATHKVKVSVASTKNYKAASKQGSIKIVKSKIATSIQWPGRSNFFARYISGFLVGYDVTLNLVDANGNILDKEIQYSTSSGRTGTMKSGVQTLIPSNGNDRFTFTFNGDSVYSPSTYRH